jgi:signal transduction histidine kinase
MASEATRYRTSSTTPRAERYGDAALTAAAFTASMLFMLHGGFNVSHRGSGDLNAASVVLVALTTVPLLAWRRSPFGVFVLTATANVLLAAFVYPIGLPLGPAVALYLVAATRDETSPSIGRLLASAFALLVAYIIAAGLAEAAFPGIESFHAGLLWSVAWFAGERTRLRREQIAELKHEAQRERLLAAAEERARIARDLHDSVGHAINVIAVRAGAARLRHRDDPDRSLLALEAIEELARRAVEDIDQFVGALREPNPRDAVEAPAALASLDTLIAQHAAAGLSVASEITGAPRPLVTAVDQAAYRILQEALTNASRHGAGSARVDVGFADDALELHVTNPIVEQRLRSANGGHGLVGMRERAALLDGNLDVEHGNGNFRVTARLPYRSNRP